MPVPEAPPAAAEAPAAIPAPPDGARESYLRVDSVGRNSRRPPRKSGSVRWSEPSAVTARRRMSVSVPERIRTPPTERQLARRRLVLFWTKWLLPLGALLLLGSIAVWPEIQRSLNAGSSANRQMAEINLESGRMLGARYHGVDVHGRPYMITADEARQAGADRLNLTQPAADGLTQDGTWVLIRARDGVYMPHAQILDLFDDVSLYRDDGTFLTGPSAVMDIRRGIVASDDWVHAEGPFGVLDAQGDLISQRDGIVQFRGPARMILNDDHIARASGAGVPTNQGPALPAPPSPGTAR